MHMLANAAEMTIFLFLGVFTITTQMQVTLIQGLYSETGFHIGMDRLSVPGADPIAEVSY